MEILLEARKAELSRLNGCLGNRPDLALVGAAQAIANAQAPAAADSSIYSEMAYQAGLWRIAATSAIALGKAVFLKHFTGRMMGVVTNEINWFVRKRPFFSLLRHTLHSSIFSGGRPLANIDWMAEVTANDLAAAGRVWWKLYETARENVLAYVREFRLQEVDPRNIQQTDWPLASAVGVGMVRIFPNNLRAQGLAIVREVNRPEKLDSLQRIRDVERLAAIGGIDMGFKKRLFVTLLALRLARLQGQYQNLVYDEAEE
jgi:hypothetical protein